VLAGRSRSQKEWKTVLCACSLRLRSGNTFRLRSDNAKK